MHGQLISVENWEEFSLSGHSSRLVSSCLSFFSFCQKYAPGLWVDMIQIYTSNTSHGRKVAMMKVIIPNWQNESDKKRIIKAISESTSQKREICKEGWNLIKTNRLFQKLRILQLAESLVLLKMVKSEVVRTCWIQSAQGFSTKMVQSGCNHNTCSGFFYRKWIPGNSDPHCFLKDYSKPWDKFIFLKSRDILKIS